MSQASQYIRGAAETATSDKSGIAVITTASAWDSSNITETVAVDKDNIAVSSNTITESVTVTTP